MWNASVFNPENKNKNQRQKKQSNKKKKKKKPMQLGVTEKASISSS